MGFANKCFFFFFFVFDLLSFFDLTRVLLSREGGDGKKGKLAQDLLVRVTLCWTEKKMLNFFFFSFFFFFLVLFFEKINY